MLIRNLGFVTSVGYLPIHLRNTRREYFSVICFERLLSQKEFTLIHRYRYKMSHLQAFYSIAVLQAESRVCSKVQSSHIHRCCSILPPCKL